jgi:hypothetical protein
MVVETALGIVGMDVRLHSLLWSFENALDAVVIKPVIDD